MALTCVGRSIGKVPSGWETTGVVFVADALGTWLVEKLADAGRKNLTALMLGSEQERALRQAATAAVRDTADEISPSDSERAGQLAMVISEVFREPMPIEQQAEVVTLLEGLQARVGGQLAVLDDAALTGIGQSSADVLEVSGAVVAERLTGHLVSEIMHRGSRGGPLAPLADQLNHDLTHLQGRRVEGMLAQLRVEVHSALAQPGGDAVVAGLPLSEVTDPFTLEVHRPVQLDDLQGDLPTLPPYVPRKHDSELERVVAAAAKGSSEIAVLVGGSSTGKTRACWEALQLLRDQTPEWRLWHPIDPSRPDAALNELAAVGPRTVVWLNEAQFYLDVPDGELGERVAAGLRELLRDPARTPVLVLATLWPQFWDRITTRPQDDSDPHAQARELLVGRDITVSAAFTPAQLQRLGQAGDARLAAAAAWAQDGQVIQFLAGVPELLARYRNAPPAAKALIHAAMDGRRLGMRPALPHAFLEEAAPGYLTDSEWDQLADDWLEQGLAYTASPCKGVSGPLIRIRPRPGRPSVDDFPSRQDKEPIYRLADYLDQSGHHIRRDQIPPAAFWVAVANCAYPGDLVSLGDAAYRYGFYRDAAQLYKHAATYGDPYAALRLVGTLHRLHPRDHRPAHWAVIHVNLGNPHGVARLLNALRGVDAREQVSTLVARDPAAHVTLDTSQGVAELLIVLREVGAQDQAAALADRAAAHAALDNPYGVARLLKVLPGVGAREQVSTLVARDPAAHVTLDNPHGVAGLLIVLREVGAQDQAAALADRAAAHAALDDSHGVARLLNVLRELRAQEQISALVARDPAAHGRIDSPQGVAELLDMLRELGAQEQVSALVARDPAAHVTLDHLRGMAMLLDALQRADAQDQVSALVARDPAAHVTLDNPRGVAMLLDALQRADAQEQISTLVARDPAAHVTLDNPRDVSRLLNALQRAGAQEQATALADRAAVDSSHGVAELPNALQNASAARLAGVLSDRPPGEGALNFNEPESDPGRFRFGRETDGRPAAPWGWEALG